LVNYRSAPKNDYIWSEDKVLPILGYGIMAVKFESRIMLLNDMAYCPDLLIILVLLRQLRRRGLYWDNAQNPIILRRKDNTLIATLLDKYGQFVIEYQPNSLPKAIFAIYRKKYTSWTKRPPFKSNAMRWHYHMGHPGPDAFERLVNITYGVKIQEPIIVKCETCALMKIKRQNKRTPRVIEKAHNERIAVDFYPYLPKINGYTLQMLLIY
jgi:hypothetical protein